MRPLENEVKACFSNIRLPRGHWRIIKYNTWWSVNLNLNPSGAVFLLFFFKTIPCGWIKHNQQLSHYRNKKFYDFCTTEIFLHLCHGDSWTRWDGRLLYIQACLTDNSSTLHIPTFPTFHLVAVTLFVCAILIMRNNVGRPHVHRCLIMMVNSNHGPVWQGILCRLTLLHIFISITLK